MNIEKKQKLKIVQPGMFTDHELGGDFIFNKGLLLNDCEVERFDYREVSAISGPESMKEQLVELCKGKDLIFIGKGQYFDGNMLRKIKQGGTKILLWYGDYRKDPEAWLMDLLPEVDCFFMSSAGETLKNYFEKGKPKIAAYYFNPSDPDIVEKYKDLKHPQRDIVFTGRFSRIMKEERIRTIKYLKSRKDVSFFGGADKSLFYNIGSRILNRLLGINVSINEVRGAEYISVIKSAKIGVGVQLNDPSIELCVSDRLTHYLMFDTLFMMRYFSGLEKLFKENEELVWFKNTEELEQKLDYYLSHHSEREKIALAGQKKILNDYNTKNITAMMLEILYTGKSERFPWIQIFD